MRQGTIVPTPGKNLESADPRHLQVEEHQSRRGNRFRGVGASATIQVSKSLLSVTCHHQGPRKASFLKSAFQNQNIILPILDYQNAKIIRDSHRKCVGLCVSCGHIVGAYSAADNKTLFPIADSLFTASL